MSLNIKSKAGQKPRRLTEAGVVELALCVAQYFYYERDKPIMTDVDYDALEGHYKSLMKKNKGIHGVVPDLLDKVGSGENLNQWLLEWRSEP